MARIPNRILEGNGPLDARMAFKIYIDDDGEKFLVANVATNDGSYGADILLNRTAIVDLISGLSQYLAD